MLQKLRGFTLSIRTTECSEIVKKKKRKEKTGKTWGSSHALQARQTSFLHRENECRAEKMAMRCHSKQCVVVSWNLRQRAESLQSRIPWRLLGKDSLLWHITIWCISLSRCHKATKFKMQRLPWKEWKKLETIPAWDLRKVKSKKESILEAQRDKMSPLYRSMEAESCSGETLQRTILVRTQSSLNKAGSSASQMTAAKSWMFLQDYQVVIDEQLMQCLPTSSTTHMAEIMGKKWRSCGTSRTKCVRTPTCWSPVERTVRGSSVGNLDGKKYQIGDVCLFIENKAYFCQFLWMTLRWLDRAEIGSNVTTCIWDALSGNANRMKQSLNSTRRCLCHVFLLKQLKNYRDGRNLTHKRQRGRSSKECVERYCKQESRATLQSFSSLFGRPSVQKKVN